MRSHYRAAGDRYETMKYRSCGTSGLKLSEISLGFWHNFGSGGNFDTMKEICLTAFDHGITNFDLANNYGPVPGSAEENFGRILRDELSAYRDEIVIATKAGWDMFPGPYGMGGSRKYLLSSLDASLKRLGVDYVDIYYHHVPDPETPIEETMTALADAVRSGKALYIGISNYSPQQTREAIAILKELHCPFVLNQMGYSIFDRRIERSGLIDLAEEKGFGIIAFCPLNQGLLTDRYLKGIPQDSRAIKNGHFLKPEDLTEQKMAQIRALHDLARERGQELSQMALAWILRHKALTSVIAGASRPSQLLQNLGALEAAPFTRDELERIDEICTWAPETV